MSTRLPRVTGIDVVAALRRAGFVVEYVKGAITIWPIPTLLTGKL